MQDNINWESLFALKFVDQGACWETCASYCCTHQPDSLSLHFLAGGAGMVFFEKEYEFLDATNRLQKGFKAKEKRWSFKLDDDVEI